MILSEMSHSIPPPKILLGGLPGVGKTALATSYGTGLQVLAIDNQLSTCWSLKDKFHSDRMSIDMIDCVEQQPTSQAMTFPKVKRHLIDLNNAAMQKKLILSNGKPLTSLCVDGLTFLFDAAMRYILFNSNKLGKERTPATMYNYSASQPEWGLVIQEMEQVIQLIRALPVPVILTCHYVSEVTASGMSRYEISIPTKSLPPKIPGYFDEVWFLESQYGAANAIKRCLRTVASPVVTARSNSNLPDGTDTSCGMKGLLSLMGWKESEK